MYKVHLLGRVLAKTLSPKEHIATAQNWKEIEALMNSDTESTECIIEKLNSQDNTWLFEAHYLKFAGMWQPMV